MPVQLDPATIPAPLARYAHGIRVPAGQDLVLTSGQLGLTPNGTVPDRAYAQATICFANIEAILAEGEMGVCDVVHLKAFVTDREYMSDYMLARDEWLSSVKRLPASTLLIVSGFTRPEFKVEIEAIAARCPSRKPL